jgi:cyanate lyase
MSFGTQNGLMPPSIVTGEANLDKVEKLELQLQMNPFRGSINPNAVPRYLIYCFAETYNILRIYGGRAGLLFAY